MSAGCSRRPLCGSPKTSCELVAVVLACDVVALCTLWLTWDAGYLAHSYTNAGPVLLAVNPYRGGLKSGRLPMFGEATMHQYMQRP